jgi:hypothetical protein
MLDILIVRADQAERLRQAAHAARLSALAAATAPRLAAPRPRRWARLSSALRLLARGA